MKKYYLLLIYTLLIMSGVYAQRLTSATIKKIVFPVLSTAGGQQTKGLYYLQANVSNRNIVLTNTGIKKPSFTIKTGDVGQLWWIIQDNVNKAFLLVSALNGKLLSIESSAAVMDILSLTDATSDSYFLFSKPKTDIINIKGITKIYGIQMANSDHLNNNPNIMVVVDYGSTDINTWLLHTARSKTLKDQFVLPSKATFGLIPVSQTGTGLFIPVPFQNSLYHNIINPFIEPGTNAEVTQIGSTSSNIQISPRNRIAVSTRATVFNLADDSLLRIKFNSTDAYVGWISAEKTTYSLGTVQGSSGKNFYPRYGVGILNDRLYVIKDGITENLPTNFVTTEPVFIGVRNGALRISQTVGTVTSLKDYYDVAIGSIMNSGAGNKAEIIASTINGSVNVSYLPSSWFFSSTDVGTELPFITSTNPDFPIIPSDRGTQINNFDWRGEIYTLKYKSGGTVVTEKALSPFYYTNAEFSGISAKHTPDGTLIGGEDNDPYSGWELIKNDFGYDKEGAPKADQRLRNEPYMILYNRVLGTLRVFVYIHNTSIANSYKVTLSVENSPMYGAASKYKPPYLWDSYLRGMALDDENISSKEYYKAKALSSSRTGNFYYTDFVMNYDPCVAFFESSIRVSVDKVTNGTMQIVGRTLGGSIPNQNGITDWMQKNDNFMQGALNQPYGSLAQTMGDMTFNNYKAWGLTDLENYAGFVLPGIKVAPWERESAKLNYYGTLEQHKGGLEQSAGEIVKGVGEAASFSTFFGLVDFGAPFKTAGSIVVAGGLETEASGTAMLAKSYGLRYRNLEDVPDQNIKVPLPALQPSLVFADLALQGTLSIQTPVFNDILIATPGSKNAQYSPEDNRNGTKGSFPYYNEPLGLINLLNKPKFVFTLMRAKAYAGYDCSVSIQEYPVFVANIMAGVSQIIPSVQIAVTTYDINGIATKSRSTKAYLQTNLTTNTGLPIELAIPKIIDLNDLIDQQTLEANYIASGGSLSSGDFMKKIPKWIKIDLQMSLITFGAKFPNGVYGGSSTTIAYQSDVNYQGIIKDVVGKNESFSYHYPGVTLLNNEFFGAKHVFNRLDPDFASLMETYCNAHQTGSIVKNTSGNTLKTSTETETAVAPALSILPIYKEGLSIFPNPTLDICNLSYTAKAAGNVHISLMDMTGKNIIGHDDLAKDKGEQKTAQIHLTGLAAGVYLIKISFADGTGYVEKVIKK